MTRTISTSKDSPGCGACRSGSTSSGLVDAATQQLGTLPYSHTFAHRSTIPVIELGEQLIKVAPEPMAKAFLTNSGSEAVDTAMKFVWYYNNGLGRPEKKKIISRRRGYHGVTIAAGSLTAIPLMQNDFDLPIDRIVHTDTPSYYRQRPGTVRVGGSIRHAAGREPGCALIVAEGPETVAAFIAEPVMGAGGVITPPQTYFEKVQEVLKRHDVLFIVDEVICGFGRTGNMWGSLTYGLRPDMVTCAKQLSSAYSADCRGHDLGRDLQGVRGAKQASTARLGMGYTYGGHPVSAAVALETLKIYEERDIVTPRAKGDTEVPGPTAQAWPTTRWLARPAVIGLIGAVELVAEQGVQGAVRASR